MFELTSLKLKNQQLIQQIVELKIQAKRERDEDSEGDENDREQHSSETISVTTSFSEYSGFEATVKPTRRHEDGPPCRRSVAHPQETKIVAEEAVIPKLNVDLDNVFREMDAKPTPPVFKVTLAPQPDVSFQPIQEEKSSLAASDISDDDLESRLPVEEPTISRICTAGSLHVLDETLRGFNEETANRTNDDDVPSTRHQSERSIKSLDQVDREGTGNESLAPQDFNTQLEQEEPLSSLSSAQAPSLSADNPNFTEDNSEGSLPPLPSSDPPPIPNSLPPSLSPSGFPQDDLDEDIEALLAEEGAGMVMPAGVVRSTLDHEVEALLESESSSVTSEPDTVLSMDSLCVSRDPGPSGGSAKTSALHHGAQDDDTEMMTSFEHDDVISPTADDSSVEALINEAPSQTELTMETKSQGKCSNRHVSFHHQDLVSDSSSVSAECGQRRKQTPPPVFPKPKYRSLSMSIPPSELPSVPAQNKNSRLPSSSMAAQRDMIDGYFPPPGLVPKRANEFNSGEYDLLKERIAFLERQLKNKEHLLQSMRAEATEIETNAYIQKKEQDLKMMDESVRFLKLENQKTERELIAKIGELNNCNFELEQWKSERESSEKQREKMEETLDSQRIQLNHLQTVDAQFQELKCKYSTLDCANAELQEKIKRLHRADEEFIELERVISDLQAKLKELGEVKRERDEFSEQLKAIKTQKNDLLQKGRKVETERNDFLMNNKLMEQQKENLEARNKALQRTNDTFKTKISSLEKECRDSQRKFFDVQRERDEGSSQLRKMEAERNELRKRVNELLEYKSELKQSQSKCHDFEREVGYLQAQYKKLETERTELSTELSNCLKERNRLEGRAAELEQLSSGNAKLEEKFHTLKIKVAELTSQRDDAEVQLPTLKAKVALLKKACKEKDERLEKMKEETQELKHSIATSAIDDLSKIQSFGFSSPENFLKFGGGLDTNNNNTTQANLAQKSGKGEKYVVLFDYDPSRLSTTGYPERELKLSEGDIVTVFGDMDMSGYYTAELNDAKGLVSSLYVEAMDEYDVRNLPKRRGLQSEKSPPKQPAILVSPPKTSTIPPELVKRQFVAIRDYNPSTSSTSGRPDLEIPLTAGEMVTVVGDVDANGYYTAERKPGGKLAIIPSNLVKPSSPSIGQHSKLSFSSSSQKTEQAPEPLPQPRAVGSSTMDSFIGQAPSHFSVASKPPGSVENLLHTQNYQTPGDSRGVNGNMSSGLQPFQNGLTEHIVRHSSVENVSTGNYETVGNTRDMNGNMLLTMQPGLPAPPRNLRVLRCVNRDALLLGWVAPEIDEMGRNNGQLIKGYRIVANGQAKLDVDSPYMAKALVENLDLSRLTEISIQTVADNGFCSEKSSTQFNEAVMQEITSVTTEDISSLDDGSPFKTYVALYSYEPTKNSPNPNPSYELEFQEGDIVRILDVSRADGFYMGQVGGKQGLVPSNFIEEIAVAARPKMQLKYSKENDFHGSNASLGSNSSSKGLRKGKVVVALYDYDPSTQSPNVLSGRELGFRKGQIIRVYGPMRSDGFYEADINGEIGLVPSSFLKEGKRRSSKSAHPTSSYTSLPRRVQFVNQQGTRQASAGYV